MSPVRNRNRHLGRCPTRLTTRRLGGARRPPPPDYLALAYRALDEVMRIDQRLVPYMEEQKQMLERNLLDTEIEASLLKVYGPPDPAHVKPPVNMAPAPSAVQISKAKHALAKTRTLITLLHTKSENRK